MEEESSIDRDWKVLSEVCRFCEEDDMVVWCEEGRMNGTVCVCRWWRHKWRVLWVW